MGYKLDVKDFRGINGSHAYNFEKLSVITGPNGTGKSSMIDALKYALTGQEPCGDMINSAAESCAVRITFPSGANYCRMKSRVRPTKYIEGKKTTTLTRVQEGLQRELGVTKDAAKLLTSRDLLASINTKEFGDLILAYLPETMTTEDILGFKALEDASEYSKQTIRLSLPEGEFSADAIGDFYRLCGERRRILNNKIRELDAVLRTYNTQQVVTETQEELLTQISTLSRKRDEQVIAAQKKAEYERAKETQERFKATVENLTRQINAITAKGHSDEERKSAALVLDAHRNTVNVSYSAMKGAENSEKALERAIANITQPVCPLSDKLVCTTDKTKVIDEMTSNLLQAKKEKEFQTKQWEQAKQKVSEAEQSLRRLDAEIAEARRREGLKRQLEELKKAEPKLPQEPAAAQDPRAIDREIELRKTKLNTLKISKKIEAYIKKRNDYTEKLRDYEFMYKAFSPKGEIKKAVTEMYMKEFERPCNEKAGKLAHGMRIRFVTENGVTIYCDTEGMGHYIPFDSLSEGEQASVTFLIMLTMAGITGLRIVIMDELSVLDKESFASILQVAKEAKDEYDLALIACVDHSDTLDVLRDAGITPLVV